MSRKWPDRPRRTIRQRLIWGNVAIGLLLLLAGSIAIWQINRLADAVGVLQVTRERATTALEVHQHSTQLVAIISRLLPVEDATVFETEVAVALDALRESHTALAALTAQATEDEVAYPLMSQVSNRIDSVIGIAETMVRQASAGQWPSVRVRVGVLVRDHQQLARETNELAELAQEMEEAAAAQVAPALQAAVLHPALVILLSITLGALLAWWTTRSIARPVEQLMEGAAHLAAGFLDKRVAVESADELGQLAATFNQMADRLQASHAELGQRVAKRTADLQQAMRELAQERNLLNATLDALPDLLFEVDRHGRILDFRAPHPELLYRPPQEFLGQPVDRILPEEAASVIMDALRQAIETGQHAGAIYLLETPMGTGWFELSIAAKGDWRKPDARFIALVRDVTAPMLAEKALRQRNRELALLNQAGQALTSTLDLDQVLVTVLEEVRHLLDVMAASVWLADPGTGELVCRQAAGPRSEMVRGWRLKPGEGIAGWVVHSGESLIVPDTWTDERHFKGVDRRIGQETRSILSVPLRVRKNVIGTLQVVDTEVNRFKSEHLALVEPLATSAAIAIDNAQLVDALRQRTAELEARNEELAAFAHTVAHDLKNPLARIVGFSEALGEDHATMPEAELRRYLRGMSRTGRKMSNIIDELLLLAGVRQMEVEMVPLDMASVVAEAQQRLSPLIEERQAEIITPDTWPVAVGYAPWVEEMWINYLSNAIMYGGDPPRVELGASPPPVPPASGGEAEGGLVRFWVRDNGPGISPEAQKRLFTPFTRLDQVSTEGHGLGLSIVRRIAERLGGQVGVESKVGQGSVFSFTLPGAARRET